MADFLYVLVPVGKPGGFPLKHTVPCVFKTLSLSQVNHKTAFLKIVQCASACNYWAKLWTLGMCLSDTWTRAQCCTPWRSGTPTTWSTPLVGPPSSPSTPANHSPSTQTRSYPCSRCALPQKSQHNHWMKIVLEKLQYNTECLWRIYSTLRKRHSAQTYRQDLQTKIYSAYCWFQLKMVCK